MWVGASTDLVPLKEEYSAWVVFCHLLTPIPFIILISIFFKQRWRLWNHTVIIHTYIYQTGAFKFRLLVLIQGNWPIKLTAVGDNTCTSPLVKYLYYHSANIPHQFCCVLSNNLNLKICDDVYPQIPWYIFPVFCFWNVHGCGWVLWLTWSIWRRNSQPG